MYVYMNAGKPAEAEESRLRCVWESNSSPQCSEPSLQILFSFLINLQFHSCCAVSCPLHCPRYKEPEHHVPGHSPDPLWVSVPTYSSHTEVSGLGHAAGLSRKRCVTEDNTLVISDPSRKTPAGHPTHQGPGPIRADPTLPAPRRPRRPRISMSIAALCSFQSQVTQEMFG